MEVKTKYVWVRVMPFVRFLAIVTTLYFAIVYAIQYFSGERLSNLQSVVFPFAFALVMLFNGRRKRMEVTVSNPSDLLPLLIEDIQKMGFTSKEDDEHFFLPPKSILNIMEDRTIIVKLFDDHIEIEGPHPRIAELGDKLQFGVRYRKFK